MPHYSDGVEAKLGDEVIGKPYNTEKVVVGKVVQIVPDSESCNLAVAFVEDRLELGDVFYGQQCFWGFRDNRQQQHFLSVKTDYGETRAFTLVNRPSDNSEHVGG